MCSMCIVQFVFMNFTTNNDMCTAQLCTVLHYISEEMSSQRVLKSMKRNSIFGDSIAFSAIMLQSQNVSILCIKSTYQMSLLVFYLCKPFCVLLILQMLRYFQTEVILFFMIVHVQKHYFSSVYDTFFSLCLIFSIEIFTNPLVYPVAAH